MSYETVLTQLGLQIPPCLKPAGAYLPVVEYGGVAYLSGQISKPADGKLIRGRVGEDLTLEEGRAAARASALNVISVIRDLIGFEHFERILRVVGYVQTSPDFKEIPQVVNGASDLFNEVFGEKGVHARSAVGMASLPLNCAVELEVTVALK